MRQYRNRVTGTVISVPCALEGPDWEDLTERQPEPKAPKTAPKKKATKKGADGNG